MPIMMQEVPHHQKRLSCSLKARKPIKAWKLERERFRRNLVMLHTVRNLHFLSKNSTLISRENCRIFGVGWKTRENVVVLDFLAVDNFDFTRKTVKKIWGEKLVKMLGFCQNWIFGQKIDFSYSVEKLSDAHNILSIRDATNQACLLAPF